MKNGGTKKKTEAPVIADEEEPGSIKVVKKTILVGVPGAGRSESDRHLKVQVPDPPLRYSDVDSPFEDVSQVELSAVIDAELLFKIARADYEKKRAAVTLKLLHVCDVEDGDYDAELDTEGNLNIFTTCDTCLQRGPHSRVLGN